MSKYRKMVRMAAIIVALVMCGARVEAQLKGKHRIGVLTPAERQWEGTAFREALRGLGYVEGSNILIDVRSAEGSWSGCPNWRRR